MAGDGSEGQAVFVLRERTSLCTAPVFVRRPGGEAVLAFRYMHPRTGVEIEIRQAVRVPRNVSFKLSIGERTELVCWGVMPRGCLQHRVLLRATC